MRHLMITNTLTNSYVLTKVLSRYSCGHYQLILASSLFTSQDSGFLRTWFLIPLIQYGMEQDMSSILNNFIYIHVASSYKQTLLEDKGSFVY